MSQMSQTSQQPKSEEEKISTHILNKIKTNQTSRTINSSIDIVVTTMEHVDQVKKKGESKSKLAENIIQFIIENGKNIIPESILSELQKLVSSNLLPSIFTAIIQASKGLLQLNIVKNMKCFGC